MPFERDEKGQKSSGENHGNMLDIIDDVSSDESEGFDQDLILDEAVRSITTLNHQIPLVNARSTTTRESKDSRGRVKSTNYSNENWIPISPHVFPHHFKINKIMLFS